MTDNEIIKAFDILEKMEFFGGQRAGREAWFNKPIDIQNQDIRGFLRDIDFLKAFINRQQAEIERLKTEIDKNFDKWHILAERTKNRYAELYEESKSVVRAKAVKEFAEKLKELYTDDSITDDYHDTVEAIKQNIDGIVKEMVGDAE